MLGWTLILLSCAVFACAGANEDEWRQVNIAQGPVRGRKDPSGDFYGFYNIPYATTPTKEDKFKAPLPPPTWVEPFDAEQRFIICPQHTSMYEAMFKNMKRQEDCLVANIYVPNTDKDKLSVVVYVHGGAFQLAHGDLFKATNFMKTKDLILVTFNYRLGVHGFLCLGTEDVPGNAGMKDQVALLRWVQQNIASFNGNPDDVTLAGYSAGSASVDLLMLSKLAEGLFHRVIPESGANLAAFAVQTAPLKNAKSYAKQLNFNNVDDIDALEKFYKTASFDELTSDWFFDRPDSTFLFSPCVERAHEGAFLTESPLKILKSGNYRKLPLLYGFANMEGLMRADLFDLWADRMNEKFSDFLPADLHFKNDDEKEEVAKQIKQFYFGDEPVGPDTVTAYIDYFSDVIFTYPTLWAVKLHVEAGHDQIYLYEYSYSETETPVGKRASVHGAPHCAQTNAVFDGLNLTVSDESHASPEYTSMKKIMRELWHNFMKTGKPVPEGSSLPEWPAVGLDRSPHMSLNLPLRLRGTLLADRTRLWDQVYRKYYREPSPPPSPFIHEEL